MTSPTVLSVDRLEIEIGETRVPSTALSIELHAGEVLGLSGPSGAGKSLAALAMIGLLPKGARVVAGSIRTLGCDLATAAPEELRRIRGRGVAMVFQDPYAAWNPVRSIGAQISEAIRAHLALDRAAASEAVASALAQVGMKAPQAVAAAFPHQLSGGMRQRALIAMAIAHNPKLLIGDEPTAQLDALSAQRIIALFKRLVDEQGLGLLWISHDRAQLEAIAGARQMELR